MGATVVAGARHSFSGRGAQQALRVESDALLAADQSGFSPVPGDAMFFPWRRHWGRFVRRGLTQPLLSLWIAGSGSTGLKARPACARTEHPPASPDATGGGVPGERPAFLPCHDPVPAADFRDLVLYQLHSVCFMQ